MMLQIGVVSATRIDRGLTLKPSRCLTEARIVGLGLMLVLAAAAQSPLAAPVLHADEQGPVPGSDVTPTRARPSIGAGGVRPSTAPETSTGDKNLDLLLELQGKAGEQGVMAPNGAIATASATPASAAAAAAAAKALAALRAKAAQQLPAEGTQVKPVLPFNGGTALLDEDTKRIQPTERREWAGGGGDPRDGRHESSGPGRADHPLLKLPMEVIAYLRENRVWVLSGLGLLVLLGAALKAYSRRV